MKEKVNIIDYANVIVKALPKGILLNTYADKFNRIRKTVSYRTVVGIV